MQKEEKAGRKGYGPDLPRCPPPIFAKSCSHENGLKTAHAARELFLPLHYYGYDLVARYTQVEEEE